MAKLYAKRTDGFFGDRGVTVPFEGASGPN